ncbi:MAG: hypothetical protein MN733_24740, partial [Nitrososphaera sp.]|nr:hypothetical protein [Nitrososphaera sp.]
HIFVITSPTSEEKVARTMVELVGHISASRDIENAVTRATSTLSGRLKEQTVAAAMVPPPPAQRIEPTTMDRRGPALHRARPEAINMLQGYLMGLEAGCTIEDDVEGRYKIKALEDDSRLSWSLLEKISSVFKDKLVIHDIGTDADGRVFVRISTK